MTIHDFDKSLEFSVLHAEFWKRVYKKAFPVLLSIEDKSKDMVAQALGIDTIIHLPFKGVLKIDEKLRKQDYGDILIEFISNDKKNTKGWIEKDLDIDFIAYGVLQTRTTYLIPFKDLQELWRNNKERWIETYGTKKARNVFYNTVSVPVPLKELRSIRNLRIVKA